LPIPLRDSSSLQREIYVTGIGPVNVEITPEGLSFWVKGSRKRVRIVWLKTIAASSTSMDVPSYLAGSPVELLAHYAGRNKD